MSNFSQPAGQTRCFTAAFDSDCDSCGGEIWKGERAGYLPGSTAPSCYHCIEERES